MKSVWDELRHYVINLKRPRPTEEGFRAGKEKTEKGAKHKTLSVMRVRAEERHLHSEGVRPEPLWRVKKDRHLESSSWHFREEKKKADNEKTLKSSRKREEKKMHGNAKNQVGLGVSSAALDYLPARR